MSNKYILEGHKVVEEPDLLKWGKWFGEAKIKVKKTKINEVTVSTVFLGIDYNFSQIGPPLLFETLVFEGDKDGEMDRCSTWEEAEIMHEKMCQYVKEVKP